MVSYICTSKKYNIYYLFSRVFRGLWESVFRDTSSAKARSVPGYKLFFEEFFEFLGEGGDYLKEVPYNAVGRYFEYGSIGVFIDGDDDL